jgi:hypothetical protein
MKTKLYLIVVMLGVLIINSCAPSYIPNVINAPLLSNKGEFQARLNSGISGFDPQFSYAVTDNIGVMLNGSYNYQNDSDSYHKHYFIESGAGYFGKLQESGRFEVFGGYGYGDVKTLTPWLPGWVAYADGYYHRIFIQPSIGAVTNVFEGSFSTRFVMVNMHFRDYYGDKPSADNSFNPFIEPVITAKIGYKYVKFVTQIGFSIPLGNNYEDLYDYQPFIFSMGVNLKFGHKYNDN